MKTSDDELLALAAKAARIEWDEQLGCFYNGRLKPWNPRDDDGDSFRLAVVTNLWIGQHDGAVTVSDGYGRFKGAVEEEYNQDPVAATRLAILRAAAEIGKTLK